MGNISGDSTENGMKLIIKSTKILALNEVDDILGTGGDEEDSEGENFVPALSSKKKEKEKKVSNTRRKSFNHKLFLAYTNKSKNKLRSNDEKKIKDLPLINNRYECISLLGKGHFGVVIKVLDKKNDKIYALKAISLSVRDIEDETFKIKKLRAISSAETEWNLLPQLKNHPNIVSYEESFLTIRNPLKIETGSTHFCLIMEYINGSNLEELIEFVKEEKMSIPKTYVLFWFLKLLDAVKFFHSKNIVHRDIKPDNIMVVLDKNKMLSKESLNLDDVRNINLKIADFGVSEKTQEGTSDQISGHMYFLAPEVFTNKEYDMISDLWNMGILFGLVYNGVTGNDFIDQVKILLENSQEEKEFVDFKRENSEDGEQDDENPKTKYKNIVKLFTYLHKNSRIQNFARNFLYPKEKVRYSIVDKILDLMICERSKRLAASEILKTKLFQTIDFVLNLQTDELECESKAGTIEKFSEIEFCGESFVGILTLINTNEEQHIYLQILKFVYNLLLSPMESVKIVKREIETLCFSDIENNEVFKILINKCMQYPTKFSIQTKMCSILCSIIKKNSSNEIMDYIHNISASLRKLGYLKLLSDILLVQRVKQNVDSEGLEFWKFMKYLMLSNSNRSFYISEKSTFKPKITKSTYNNGNAMENLRDRLFFGIYCELIQFNSTESEILSMVNNIRSSGTINGDLIDDFCLAILRRIRVLYVKNSKSHFLYCSSQRPKFPCDKLCIFKKNINTPKNVCAFYEVFVIDSGNGGFFERIGFQDDEEETSLFLNTKKRMVSGSERKLSSIIVNTGDYFGCGLLENGVVFFSKNNEVIGTFPWNIKDGIAVIPYVVENQELEFRINSKKGFQFRFSQEKQTPFFKKKKSLIKSLNSIKRKTELLNTTLEILQKDKIDIEELDSVILEKFKY